MRFNTILLILLNYLLFIQYIKAIKYNIIIKGFDTFEGIPNRFQDFKELKLTKYNKTHWTLNGVFTILRDDIPRERLLFSVRGARKMGNGYQESSLLQLNKINLCDNWYYEPYFMPRIRESVNFTSLQCPYPVGTYAMVNYVPDTNTLPPYIPGRYWRVDYIIYDQDKKVSHDRIYAELVPVESPRF